MLRKRIMILSFATILAAMFIVPSASVDTQQVSAQGQVISLAVPLLNQNNYDGCIPAYGCAATSAAMVLQYFGVNASPSQLRDAVGGCWANWIVFRDFANQRGANLALAIDSTYSVDWAAINYALSQGWPVIIGGDHMGVSGGPHWVVIVGRDGSNYYVNDPWTGTRRNLNELGGVGVVQHVKAYSGTPPTPPGDLTQEPPEPPQPPPAQDGPWCKWNPASAQWVLDTLTAAQVTAQRDAGYTLVLPVDGACPTAPLVTPEPTEPPTPPEEAPAADGYWCKLYNDQWYYEYLTAAQVTRLRAEGYTVVPPINGVCGVQPTEEPTIEPTEEPTVEPTEEPTVEPTEEPTEEPGEVIL